MSSSELLTKTEQLLQKIRKQIDEKNKFAIALLNRDIILEMHRRGK